MTVTIHNLENSTEQEVFNTVGNHLLTQREQAISASGSCVYLSCNGLKCAVGCLIPLEDYKLEYEYQRLAYAST